jgi:superfamily II DNA/RNA helicase
VKYTSTELILLPQALSLSSLDSLVIDEADLIFSYGHDEDVRQIFGGSFLPKVFQSFLMSATMTEDVELLKSLALRNPVRQPGLYSKFILMYIQGNPETGRRRGRGCTSQSIQREVCH